MEQPLSEKHPNPEETFHRRELPMSALSASVPAPRRAGRVAGTAPVPPGKTTGGSTASRVVEGRVACADRH